MAKSVHLYRGFYQRPLILSISLVCFLIIISSILLYSTYRAYDAQKIEVLDSKLELTKAKIIELQKAASLEAFNLAMEVNADGEVHKIDSIGKVILDRSPFIMGIETVPDGIVKDVYPLEKHAAAIGLDVLKLESAKKEALKTIENKQVVFAGPLTLAQGGEAIIARLPIFRNGKFWGFSAVLIDLSSFLREIGIQITDSPKKVDVQLAFFKLDENGEVDQSWNAPNSNLGQKRDYVFPSSNWMITAYNEINTAYYITLIFLVAFFLFFSISSGFYLYSSLKRPLVLKKLLAQKSKELLIQNNYFSSLISALPDLVFIFNKKGDFLNFHSSITKGLIDKPDNFIGKNLADYLDEETSQKLIAKFNYTIEHSVNTSHTYSIKMDGVLEYFEARIVKISEDQVLSIVRQISDVVRANIKLQESESKYRNLVQQAPDCIFQTDSEGKILNINRAGTILTGYKSNELINKEIESCLLLENEESGILSYLRSPEIETKRAILIDKSGDKIQVEVSAKVNPDGTILGITRDITERMNYIKSIEERNIQLREIAWEQSHKVREPLSKIMSLVDYLIKNSEIHEVPRQHLYNELKNSSNEFDNIIRQIVKKSEEALKNE